MIEDEIIYTVYDFISLADLTEEEISELFNVKKDSNFKDQIKEIKELKKKYFTLIKKYFDIENEKSSRILKWFSIIAPIIVLFTAIFIYKII